MMQLMEEKSRHEMAAEAAQWAGHSVLKAKASMARGLAVSGLYGMSGPALQAASGAFFDQGDARPIEHNTESYSHLAENAFRKAVDHPLSTFSIDVDAASYSNVRRFLGQGQMPPKDAVRIEELINYFPYSYPEPAGEHPFSITTEAADCPWKTGHKLVRIGLKGKSIAKDALPPSNLVFLIDTSGSMSGANRIGLVKQSMRLLVEQLRPQDKVAIVAYAGSAGLVLPSTSGQRKADILAALELLEAGGSTAGGAGLELAYKTAAENFMKGGNNRVILATDGDFNVGMSSEGEMVRLIEAKRERGVFLTVLGYGMGNYKDSMMEKLADKGNGNYAYIDDILEARKVLVQEMGGTLWTIAKDVKIQVEFNPARVAAYRLIGYENRVLASEDFNDDKKDAGELGSGHTVTALYEVIPSGMKADLPSVDELKYSKTVPVDGAAAGPELLTVKFRYKQPEGSVSKLQIRPLDDKAVAWEAANQDFKFAAAVAAFGMLLRGSEHSGSMTYKKVEDLARSSLGSDPSGYRAEFLRLVEKAQLLDSSRK
jgi:Ca-activated chloride channel family protein